MASALSRTLGKNKKMVSIPVYYRYKEGQFENLQFQILTKEEAQKALQSGDKNVETLNTKWKPRSWQVSNLIVQNSQSYNPQTGNEELDLVKYQDNLIKQCLVSWDLTDEAGAEIPPSPENIEELPVEIIRYLVSTYDRSNIITAEERKK